MHLTCLLLPKGFLETTRCGLHYLMVGVFISWQPALVEAPLQPSLGWAPLLLGLASWRVGPLVVFTFTFLGGDSSLLLKSKTNIP